MRTMKKYIYQLAFAGLLLSAASCSKTKLNPLSTTNLSDASAFQTKDRIANLVNGLYGSLKSGNLYGGRYLIYGDVRGDNFLNQTGNVVTAYAIWNFTVTGADGEITGTWDDAYSAINQANLFLDGMAAGGNDVAGATLAKQYAGEAKFVRAVAYYTLLQLYAQPYTNGNGSQPGLPLRLTGIKGSGFNNLARSSVGDVYKQILSDLNDAESALPSDYGDDALNTTHAHVNTAIAFKTRVYLSMADYANVITEANKIVSASAPFKAPSGVANALQSDIKAVFSTYTTTESILSMPFTGANEAPGTQNQLAYYYLSPALGGNGEFSLNPAGIVADASWTATDARRSFINNDGAKQWLTKWPGGNPYIDWVPVMRYSEVLLNLAEARTRSTNSVDAQAVALLNAVRHRADPSTTFTAANFPASSDLISAILKERNIEFLGEGLRSPDIMRLGMTFPGKGSVGAVAPTDPGYIFPAPSTEIQYNSLW